MRYTLEELATLPVAEEFTTLDTVTISIIDLATGSTVPITSAVCSEIGTTGQFKWDFSNLTTQPTAFKRYLWIMDNGSIKKSKVVDVAGWVENIVAVNSIIEFPAITMDRSGVNIGDTWTPRFEVKAVDAGMKVKLAITDGGGNVLSKATSNVAGGADDQVKLICAGDVFSTFRFYLSASETSVFTGNSIHTNITVELSDLTKITIAAVVPISSTAAISF